MFRKTVFVILISLVCWGLATSADAAISKVAKRLNVLEIYGGYALPVGSYDGIDVIDFVDSQGRLVDLDAEDVYDPGFCLGLNYGQLRNNHLLYSVGFRWTHINTEDEYVVDPLVTYYFLPETPAFNQYDIDFNLDYFVTNPSSAVVSPYVGVGFHGGVTSSTLAGFESNNNVTLALGINFGVDVAVWKAADQRSFAAISSVNEWVLAASDGRPKYLNLGAALKYYFRP